MLERQLTSVFPDGERGLGHYKVKDEHPPRKSAVPTPAPAPTPVPATAALEPETESVAQPLQPRRAAAQRPSRSWPSAEETRKFVEAAIADNGWDDGCCSRMIRFEADGASFEVKVPRSSRAGETTYISAVQIGVRLKRVMSSTASHPGHAMDGWRHEFLAWLLSPQQPSLYVRCG